MHITVDFESIKEMKSFCEAITGVKTAEDNTKENVRAAVPTVPTVGNSPTAALGAPVPGIVQPVVQTANQTAIPVMNQPAVPITPVQPPVSQPVIPTAPVQPPVQQQSSAPVAQGVPTSQTTYTLDDLSSAGVRLMESGRQGDLTGLLRSFGVDALPALPREQYGAFATALREMGAQI